MQDKLAILRQAFAEKGTLDPRVIAWHEAAHIVVGEVLGKRLVEVRLDDTPGRFAVTEMKWDEGIGADQRRLRDAAICMAGPLMDQMLTGTIDTTDTDHQQAELALSLTGITEAGMVEGMKTAGRHAAKIIGDRIDEIVTLGILIVAQKRLTRDDLAKTHKLPLFQSS